MNKRIVVHVGWCEKNYDGGWGDPECGIIISTGRTLDDFKQDFKEALDFHIESMAEDKDTFPEWMANGQYEIEYYLHTSALLHEAERFTTLTAISRASGISKKVLQALARRSPVPCHIREGSTSTTKRTHYKSLKYYRAGSIGTLTTSVIRNYISKPYEEV